MLFVFFYLVGPIFPHLTEIFRRCSLKDPKLSCTQPSDSLSADAQISEHRKRLELLFFLFPKLIDIEVLSILKFSDCRILTLESYAAVL
jgi:hypothetical protein